MMVVRKEREIWSEREKERENVRGRAKIQEKRIGATLK